MALTRRQFVTAAAAAGAWAYARPGSSGLSLAAVEQLPLGIRYDPAPFQCGVASGDPQPDSVVLWTRLTREPLRGGGMPAVPVPVRWVVAADPQLRRVVRTGTVVAESAMAHTVHVDVRGLAPGTVYWYAFRVGAVTSRVGRTKTAPVGPTSRVRFGFGSCQNLPTGRYGAYADVLRQDLDFFVHLGDYVYEDGGSGEDGSRDHTGGEALTLEDYRNRYALYRGDPQLRAAHAHLPFVMTWDDHEVSDNYAGSTAHPLTAYVVPDDGAVDPVFVARRAAAYQAYYDMMPIRLPAGPPRGPDLRIYRTLQFGDLLSLPVVDTRQYRDVQAYPSLPGVSNDVADPDRTILGSAQRDWLLEELGKEDTAWRCVANQVAFAAIRLAGAPPAVGTALPDRDPHVARMFGVAGDTWDGYQHDRSVVQECLARRGDANTIVLTGDIHSFWTSEIKADYNDPASETLGVEFITGGISSGGNGQAGETAAFQAAIVAGGNGHIRYTEQEHCGYGICDVTPTRWRTTYRLIEDVDVPNPRFLDDAVFEVLRDRAGVRTLQG